MPISVGWHLSLGQDSKDNANAGTVACGVDRRTLGQWFPTGRSSVCQETFGSVCRQFHFVATWKGWWYQHLMGGDLSSMGVPIFSKGYWEN